MTYVASRPRSAVRRYTHRRPRPAPMAGLWDDIINIFAPVPAAVISSGTDDTTQCLDAANSQVAPLDAKITDLAKNWNPTGFYTPAELRQVVSATLDVVKQGYAALTQSAQQPNFSDDAGNNLMEATNELGDHSGHSLDYINAAAAAEKQGVRLVNAPGLKQWVTSTMASASHAMVVASVISCMTPWWADALTAFGKAIDALWAVTKQVVGAALSIGETALKVANDLPAIYDVLKWVLLVGGVYVLWAKYGAPHAHSHT